MIEFAVFTRDLLRALWHLAREKYYVVALNHVGPAHPDAWLISRRLTISRAIVNDFIRQRLNG